MRSDNKLVSVRVVGPPTKSYQVCPFLATISQDKSRKKRGEGWIKKYGWGAKKSANQRSAGKLRLNTRFEHHFSLISIMIMIISPWYRTKEPNDEVRKCIERDHSKTTLQCEMVIYSITQLPLLVLHPMFLTISKHPPIVFLEIPSLFFELDLWRRRWRGEVDSYHFHIIWTARY